MSGLQKSKVFPKGLNLKPIPNAGSHIYSRGLSPFSQFNQFGQKRHIFYNPYIMLTVIVINSIRSLTVILMDSHRKQWFIYLADYSHFLGVKNQFNFGVLQYYCLAISTQGLYFWLYCNGKYPTFMKVFVMFSGKLSPNKIGLIDKREIAHLFRQYRIIARLSEWNPKVMLVFAWIIVIVPIYLNLDKFEFVLFGIPWSVMYALSSIYGFTLHHWNIGYFYIVCHYLRIKLKQNNDKIKYLTELKSHNWGTILAIIKSLKSIHMEIEEYNRSFWSKYSLFLVVFMVSFMDAMLFLVLFCRVHVIIKILFFYIFLFAFILITFYFKTASAVSHESFRTYSLLTKLVARIKSKNTINKIFKLNRMIEIVGDNKIGFYCGPMFLINKFHFYQILVAIVGYLLKIIESFDV